MCACLFMCMTFALHSPLPGCCVRIGALPCILCLVRRPVRPNPAWLPRCDHLLQPGHLPHRLHGCYVRDSDHASSEPRCLCVCPSRCVLLGRDTGTQRRPPAQAPSPSPQLSGLEGMRACGHVGMGPKDMYSTTWIPLHKLHKSTGSPEVQDRVQSVACWLVPKSPWLPACSFE